MSKGWYRIYFPPILPRDSWPWKTHHLGVQMLLGTSLPAASYLSKSKVEDPSKHVAKWLGLTWAFLTPGGFHRNNERNPTFALQKNGVQMEAELKKGTSILKNSKKNVSKALSKKKKKTADEERTVSLPILRVWQQRMGCRCLKGLLVWSPRAAWFYTSATTSRWVFRTCGAAFAWSVAMMHSRFA